MLIVFCNSSFEFTSLVVVVAWFVIRVSEKRAANIRCMTNGTPMLAIRRAPADYDTQASCLGPTLYNIVIRHCFHRWYIVDIPDSGIVYYQHAWHRCDREQSWWLFMKSCSQRSTLSFLIFLKSVFLLFWSLTSITPLASNMFSCISFMVYIYSLILRLFFRRGWSYFTCYEAPIVFPVVLRTVTVLT